MFVSLTWENIYTWKSTNTTHDFFFFELVYWPYKLTLLFLTVEILDDARIQILESFTVAEAEVSPPFLIY